MGSDTRTSKLVIVSGRSGSGKSTALHVLEDAGFYCIDNLPGVLLPELVTQAESRGDASLQRMAVSIDARNMASSLAGFAQILLALPRTLTVEVIYLDADDATLIKRFSETRRPHPLAHTHRRRLRIHRLRHGPERLDVALSHRSVRSLRHPG